MPAEPGRGRLLFRVDGGRIAGVSLGHVFRCLALARELDAAGRDCLFLMRADPRGPAVVRERGFAVVEFGPEVDLEGQRRLIAALDPDLVVVDLLRPDLATLAACRLPDRPQVLLDDLGGVAARSDLVVNGSAVAANRYYPDAPGELLLGPDYMVLGPEFRGRPAPAIAEYPVRVLVTLGGSDPAGLAGVVLESMAEVMATDGITFIAGPAFAAGPGRRETLEIMKTRFRVQENVPDLSMSLMSADLVVTAGGRTAYELAALGIPALVVPTCGHEVETARALAAEGSCLAVSGCEPGRIRAEIAGLLDEAADPERRRVMSRAGRALVDGRGGERVSRAMIALVGD
ncbi:MAG: hypothetical protein H6807_04350 [Planctomycetes bacterium]|nr:hypothetical protein [Planctomycetota bacterium]